MRTQDIKIGEFYRHIGDHNYGYAKALEILKPKPKFRCKSVLEENIKFTVVKCEWTLSRNDTFGFIKYFRPCDLIKSNS